MHRRRRTNAALVPIALGLAACNAISGLDGLVFNRDGGAGTGGQGGAGGGHADAGAGDAGETDADAGNDGGGLGDAGADANDGAPAGPPSCDSLGYICGPAQNEDCCASPLVPGGTVSRSLDGANMATVQPFRLDRFEVTVGRFRRFFMAYATAGMPHMGAGANPYLAKSGWDPTSTDWYPPDGGSGLTDQATLDANLKCKSGPGGGATGITDKYTWTSTPAGGETLPINCVSWYEAFAFCAWDGGWLPTEAEWLFAAVGSATPEHKYPWGDTDPTDISYANFNCTNVDGGAIASCVSPNALVPVGKTSPKGDGPYMQADLAGNAFELTLDWFGSFTKPCNDCATLSPGSPAQQVIRGGSWFDKLTFLNSAVRTTGGGARSSRSFTVGFRCARAP